MNPLTRHFLPSQVRGVYRFDDTFGKLTDENYSQYVSNKLRFLPRSIEKIFRDNFDLTENFTDARKQLYLDGVINNTRVIKQRYSDFFTSNPYFCNALGNYDGADNYLEIEFVKRILTKLLNATGMDCVQPQKSIGRYYADFAIESGTSKVVIEIDGFGKFKHRSNLDEFIERQNFIACDGWKVIRFTYGQVMTTTESSLRKLYDFLNSDPNFQPLLTTTKSQANLWESTQKASTSTINVADLVNGFYSIQDWFVEYAIKTNETNDGIVLHDGFGHSFPVVALAVSSLYEFLESVSSIVDIEFNLPPVLICGHSLSHTWGAMLHQSVTALSIRPRHATIVDSTKLLEYRVLPPVPICSSDNFSLRKGLSVGDLHQNLEYITREIFGYEKGTNQFQDKILKRHFDGLDTLGISSTGSGKSFCFWLPSLLRPGLTLVIAPLRSLMRDQRLTLFNYGVASMEFINSDVEATDKRRFMEEIRLGYIRLLYISPERMRIKSFMEELNRLQQFVPINLIAIDEAHCLSEWGHDFRPCYLKIPSVRESLSNIQSEIRLIALTATAGEKVEKDVRNILKFKIEDVESDPIADRKCFSYQIVQVHRDQKNAVYKQALQIDLPKALKLTPAY